MDFFDFLYKLRVPTGIVTFFFLLVTLWIGRYGRRLKIKHKYHKLMATFAITIATIHGAIVVYTTYF